jgi:hypothetical protein
MTFLTASIITAARPRQRPSSRNNTRLTRRRIVGHHGQETLLLLLTLLIFLWHIYNLQTLDRWVSQHTSKTPITMSSFFFANPDNLPTMLAMGPHFLTTTSGCRMAKWVYSTATQKKRFRDCHLENASNNSKTLTHATITGGAALNQLLQPYDTIYVTLQKLPDFVAHVLPHLHTDVVVLTGQIYQTPPLLHHPEGVAVVRTLLDHAHVVHWCCQNLRRHYRYHDQHGRSMDAKVSPFPYGLKQTVHKHHSRDEEAFNSYKRVFWETLSNNGTTVDERKGIYVGPLHPWPHRLAKKIPGAAVWNDTMMSRLGPLDFYRQMARHRFVLSPNGDRPECYRHYEALGLGVVPITELDPQYYFHFQDGPIVYDTVDWDLMHLQRHVDGILPFRGREGALRNMILEEYWMEYVERRVGRRLNWGRELWGTTESLRNV